GTDVTGVRVTGVPADASRGSTETVDSVAVSSTTEWLTVRTLPTWVGSPEYRPEGVGAQAVRSGAAHRPGAARATFTTARSTSSTKKVTYPFVTGSSDGTSAPKVTGSPTVLLLELPPRNTCV